MLSSDAVVKEEMPSETNEGLLNYVNFSPNIFVKEEFVETDAFPTPSANYPTQGVPLMKSNFTSNPATNSLWNEQQPYIKKEERQELNGGSHFLDPAFYQIPIYRRAEKVKREIVKAPNGEPLMKKVTPRFTPNPGRNAQEALENLMLELEDAQTKEDASPATEYPCPVQGCPAIFSTSCGLTRHKALHTNSFRCTICHKVVRTIVQLQMHHSTVHGGTYLSYEEVPTLPRVMQLAVKPSADSKPNISGVTNSKGRIKLKSFISVGEAQQYKATRKRKQFVCTRKGCSSEFDSRLELDAHSREHVCLFSCSPTVKGSVSDLIHRRVRKCMINLNPIEAADDYAIAKEEEI